ncbi:MAG: hypothetical protein ACFE0Q_04800 [Anaerolineae bacterium]
MTKVVILDDGISYFTNPTKLQKIYGRFWDEGIPVNLAITPALHGAVHSAQDPTQYYGGIPQPEQGTQRPFKISNNHRLCDYLNVMAEQRLVEICLRGYSGALDEFNSDDDILLQQKIEEGLSELQSAFPDASIQTFILPEKDHAKTAIQLLTEYDFHIGAYHSQPSAPRQLATSDEPDEPARTLFTYGKPLLSPNTHQAQVVIQRLQTNGDDFVIIRQAYWALYDTHQNQTGALYPAWETFVSELLALPHLEIDTFSFI